MHHGAFQVLLAVQRCHAAAAGGRNGLAVLQVLHVAASEYARDVRFRRSRLHHDVAMIVGVDLAAQELRVRRVADGDEDAVGLEDLLLAALVVADLQSGHAERACNDFNRRAVEGEADLLVVAGAVLHDFGCAHLVAAVDQVDVGRKAGEEVGLLHGGISASDHDDLFAAEEEAVASGASADSASDVLLLSGNAEVTRGCAGRDDQGFGDKLALAFHLDLERTLRQVDAVDPARTEFSAETLGLLAHVGHELRTHDAIRESGEVLDFRRRRQLAARLRSFDDERAEVGAGQIDRSGQTGRAGTDDNGLVHGCYLLNCLLDYNYSYSNPWQGNPSKTPPLLHETFMVLDEASIKEGRPPGCSWPFP
ncbi:hypothetical protein BN871_BS_00340 [Paenibacillus sp. P22]|nr:hypothetical protein BN871_BS_00340 [Paenibacillus sp. P22]